MGKIWKYTEEALAHWMAKALEEYGRPPQVAEYDWWRQRELLVPAARTGSREGEGRRVAAHPIPAAVP